VQNRDIKEVPMLPRSPAYSSPENISAEKLAMTRRIAGIALIALFVTVPRASLATKLGVMGDSLSDEYGHESYSYADNWVEQLVIYRGIDVGPTGSWGEPRRNGFYEYNWARAGATSGALLSAGQHTGLAAQVAPNSIEYGVLLIGANDQFFDGTNAYFNIYSGSWSSAQIDTWVNGIVSNINTALSTVAPTGIKLVLFNVPDYGVTPAVQAAFPNASGRQAVTDVLTTRLNPQVEALADLYDVVYIDSMGFISAVYGSHTSPNSTFSIGNVLVYLNQSDTSGNTNPQAAAVHDGIHPHTTLQGVIANLIVEGFKIGYGLNLARFSEAEILSHAGLAYGGSDTVAAQIGPYSNYVVDYAPEPDSLMMTICGAASVVALHRLRRLTA
jgi:phospholipase/lecithinase/hemolysin